MKAEDTSEYRDEVRRRLAEHTTPHDMVEAIVLRDVRIRELMEWQAEVLRGGPTTGSGQDERERLSGIRSLLTSDQKTYDVPGLGVGWYLLSREKYAALMEQVDALLASPPPPSSETADRER